MTDGDLLALLRDDPERGLAQMIAQYGGYVYTIVRNKLCDAAAREDIEETVSDVFVKLWQWRKAHPDEPANLRALLAIIAKRHAINRFYAITKQPVCDNFEMLLETAQEGSQPDDSVILMQAVRDLGEPDSEIILRRYYFGQTSREIGTALGLAPNTVDQKLSRGLKKLRAIWKEE